MDSHDESHGRGLKGMLSRKGRSREDSAHDRSDSRGTRGDSSESGPEKFKPRPSLTGSEAESVDGKKSKLLAGRSKRKEKAAAKGGDDAQQHNAAATPGRGADDASTNGSAHDAEAGSMMTSDSDGERDSARGKSPLAAPPLLSHESHAGYLTSSSPQVKATSVGAPAPERQNTVFRHTTAGSNLSVNSAHSAGSHRSRSVSPGAMIKGAFRPGSRKATASNEALRKLPSASNLAEKNQATTIASRRLSKIATDGANSAPYVQTSGLAASQSNKSLPSIVMTPETPPPLPNSSYEKLPLPVAPGGFHRNGSEITVEDQSEATTEQTPSKGMGFASIPFAHRRTRSDSNNPPTRFSHPMNPPLTPMIEEVKTPPSRHGPTASGGFFTTMFSAAQNAANTLTTTLTNTGNRPRSATVQTQPAEEEITRDQQGLDAEAISKSDPDLNATGEQSKPLAIETIGTGDLSLSHLGISNDASPAPAGSPALPSTPADSRHSRSRSGTVVRREEASAREEGISAARAVSAAYEEKPEDVLTPMVEDVDEPKISMVHEGSIGGNSTPNGSILDGDGGGILRTSSLKNKLDRKSRRRGGSQSTVGAAIAASGASLISTTSAPKMSGFAVASKKRNRDFHALFRSVPEDDYLIEDYSCALQRDIILAGRIYISEGHICFSSNILGWVTTLVISFDEVVSVEKESTAMVFPNAIAVQTLHARHTFRSLLSREATYDLLIGIWKINHPGLMSSENGVRVANGTGSKTEKLEHGQSDNDSDDSDDDGADADGASDGSDDDQGSSVTTGDGDAPPADASTSPPKSSIPHKASAAGITAGQAATPPTAGDAKAAEQASGAAAGAVDFPGPQTHTPSECSDQATHYPTVLKDEVIPAPLGKIYAMTFGTASGGFMSRWLLDEMKVTDLQMEDDKKGLGEENKTRSYSYIKPLGGSIGPKQTKCIISEQLDAFDLEKAVSITVTTQTPDVPSGNVFSVKTRYCLMWGPNNGTRMIMTCVIEWTGKSWLKGPIEKGANDGQTSYANDLYKALRAAVSKGKSAANGTPGKKKSKKKKTGDADKSTTSLAASTEKKKSDWGMFEPLHGIFGPVADILSPFFSLHALVGLLSIALIYTWLRRPNAAMSALPPRTGRAARIAAYEELWRSEEAALWTWLEERVGIDEGLAVPIGKGRTAERVNADQRRPAQHERQQVLRGASGRPMGEKEVRRAVELTEEKLRVLKEAVQKVRVDGEGESQSGA